MSSSPEDEFIKKDVDLRQNHGPALIATCAVLLPLTWLAVGLRTYARAVMTKNFQIDDWFMLVAQLTFTLTCAFVLAGVGRGLGKHNAALAIPDLVAALMSAATSIYILDMMFVKLSIGIFLLRLGNVWAVYKWILWVSLIIVTLWSIGLFFWDIFQCTPVQKQWDFRIERGHCASPKAIISSVIALTVLTVSSDWLYALLPIPMVWSVKMTRQAKATVIVILGLGIFASIATLVRLRFLKGLQEFNDLSYTASETLIWSLIEPGVAIFASSIATIRPLLRFCKIKGFTTTIGRSRTEKSQAPPPTVNEGKKPAGQEGPEAFTISDISLNSPVGGQQPLANDNSELTPLEMAKQEGKERKMSTLKGPWAAYGFSDSFDSLFDGDDDDEGDAGEEIDLTRTTTNYGNLSLENFGHLRASQQLQPPDGRPLGDSKSDNFVVEDRRRASRDPEPVSPTGPASPAAAGDVDLEAQAGGDDGDGGGGGGEATSSFGDLI